MQKYEVSGIHLIIGKVCVILRGIVRAADVHKVNLANTFVPPSQHVDLSHA